MSMALAQMGKRLRKANQGKSEMKKTPANINEKWKKKSKGDNTLLSVLASSV